MSRFDRHWTLHLKIDKQDFIDAFHDVVLKDPTFIMGRGWLPDTIGKDFFGKVYDTKFYINKRNGFLEERSIAVDGKIVPETDGVLLELSLKNNLPVGYINYLKTFICAVVCAVGIGTQLPYFYRFALFYCVVAIPVVFIILLKIQFKMFQYHLDRLQKLYTKVLKAVEERAMLK
jgi:hypothetical protein